MLVNVWICQIHTVRGWSPFGVTCVWRLTHMEERVRGGSLCKSDLSAWSQGASPIQLSLCGGSQNCARRRPVCKVCPFLGQRMWVDSRPECGQNCLLRRAFLTQEITRANAVNNRRSLHFLRTTEQETTMTRKQKKNNQTNIQNTKNNIKNQK